MARDRAASASGNEVRRPLGVTVLGTALLVVGVAVVAWDARYVLAPIVERVFRPEAQASVIPTPMHNLRTMLAGILSLAVGVGLLRAAVWARRAAVFAAWTGAIVLGMALGAAPFVRAGRFVLSLGALLAFANAPFLLLCQVLDALVAGGKISLGYVASMTVGVLGAVVAPVAAALYLGTGRVRRAFGNDRLHVGTLVRRELGAYFYSPIAYLVAAVFLFLVGVYFVVAVFQTLEASMKLPFLWMGWLLVFISPFLTMRLLAEERRSGTLEMVLTAPVTDVEMVTGKFVGALAFFAIMVAPTGVLVFLLRRYGRPDPGPIATGYIGIFLLGAYLIALGLLVSALSRNQVVAGAVALVANVAIAIVAQLADPRTVSGAWEKADSAHAGRLALRCVRYMGMMEHLESFLKGVFDHRDFFFYTAFTFLWLYLAVRALESRTWRY
ncbi:MAG: ABC transporter permease [Planctomycetota bacterium]